MVRPSGSVGQNYHRRLSRRIMSNQSEPAEPLTHFNRRGAIGSPIYAVRCDRHT
jgi:hypothetical protein